MISKFSNYDAQPVVTSGVAAAQLASGTCEGVTLQSDPFNTGVIYLGSTSGVTAVPALAHTALSPGEKVWIPCGNPALIWHIATLAAQKLLVGLAK